METILGMIKQDLCNTVSGHESFRLDAALLVTLSGVNHMNDQIFKANKICC